MTSWRIFLESDEDENESNDKSIDYAYLTMLLFCPSVLLLEICCLCHTRSIDSFLMNFVFQLIPFTHLKVIMIRGKLISCLILDTS